MSRFTGRLKALVLSGKLARTTLTGAALKVLLVLSAHADRDGRVAMSQRDIAALAGIVRSSVQSAVSELLDADLLWLEHAGSGRRPDVYRIITERHIDPASLGIAARSGPVHLSTTNPPSLVVDSSTGPLDAVVDSYTGPLVEDSPRARTETGLPELNTTERLGRSGRWSEAKQPIITFDAERAARSGERLPGEGAQGDIALGIRQQSVTT